MIFNNRLDAGVTGFFALLILLLLAEAASEWYRILAGPAHGGAQRDALRTDALGGGLAVSARVATALRALWRLLREWSGDAAYETYLARTPEAPPLSRQAFYLDSLTAPLPRPVALLLTPARLNQRRPPRSNPRRRPARMRRLGLALARSSCPAGPRAGPGPRRTTPRSSTS